MANMINNDYTPREGLTTGDQLAAAQSVEYQQKEQQHKRSGLIKNIIFVAVLVILAVLLIQIMAAKNNGETPHLFGFYFYTVETGSMEPTYPIGSIIIGRAVDDQAAAQLEVGTVVTFLNSENKKITHRIVESGVDSTGAVYYRTQGDYEGNSMDQDFLYPENIQSRILFKLPFP